MESESVLTVPDLVEPIFDNSDLPIAVRKGVRSCTKHPISNFISYEKLSPTFRAFTCELTKIEIPRDIQEALRVPKWKEAVMEEMRALEKNQTWKVVDLPRGKTTVGCKWVFTIKYNTNVEYPPMVFVHGSYYAAWCWAEHWLPFFSSSGHDCYAISLLGQVHSQKDN